MKLVRKAHILSGQANVPCLVLNFRDVSVMLDCSMDMSSLHYFLPLKQIPSLQDENLHPWSSSVPELKDAGKMNLFEVANHVFVDSEPEVVLPEPGVVDLADIDIILISNYHNMLSLPFITEYTTFKGKVYATEPTLQIGRLLMEELVSYKESSYTTKTSTAWKSKKIKRFLPHPLCDLSEANSWRTIYNSHDVKECMARIQPLDYSEKVDVYGILQITPLSSGFSIGSCNWLLETNSRKICYLSASSVFSTHPQPLDQTRIQSSDVMIINSLTEAPTVNPDGMLREFCNSLTVTLKGGGNVLIPCYPSGVIYDLLEYLVTVLDGSGLSFVPIYFVSPVADSSLAYANIYAEWLCQNKLSKVYLPESPFTHAELVKSGRLKHFKSLQDGFSNSFKSPCIVFTGHPSLRFGDVVHFIQLWGKSSSNTIIFIEPDFPYLDALSPFQPLAMRAYYCPIDPRLNFTQANKLIKDLKPKEIVMPERYLKPPPMQPHRRDLVIDVDCKVTTYKKWDTIDLSLPTKFHDVMLSTELCAELHPKEVEQGVAISSLSGILVTRDNKMTLNSFTSKKSYGASSGNRLFGDVSVENLIAALEQNGIVGAQWDTQDDGGFIIHLPDADAVIQINDGNTHIINHGSDDLRIKIRDALLSCLLQV